MISNISAAINFCSSKNSTETKNRPHLIKDNSKVTINAKPDNSLASFAAEKEILMLNDKEYYPQELVQKLKEIKNDSQNPEILNKLKDFNFEKRSIINFLLGQPLDGQQKLKILYALTQDPKTAPKLAKSLSNNACETQLNFFRLKRQICTNVGNSQLFNSWLNDEISGYKYAYDSYYNSLWHNASSLEELVKVSPNLAPWALENKANELNKEFTLGEIPKEFGNLEDFRELIKEIKQSNFYKTYREIKDSFVDPQIKNKIAKDNNINPNNSFAMSDVTNEILNNSAKEPIITKNGTILEPIIESFSAKLIFKIKTPNNKTFFLKMDPYRPDAGIKTDEAKKIAENQDLRPDMPYLNAMIDFYLKLNNVGNAADVQFYDHQTNTILYKATKGTEPKSAIDEIVLKNLYLLKQNNLLKNINRVGIQLNDVHSKNFIKETKTNSLILIDSGHASFSDPLRPPIAGKNITLGNLSGREYTIAC